MLQLPTRWYCSAIKRRSVLLVFLRQAVDIRREHVDAILAEQDHPRGLAHCVLICQEFVGEDRFIMYLGDNLLIGGIHDMVESFTGDASIMLTPVKNPSEFGVAVVDDDGRVERLVEKPKDPPSNLILVGIYAFGPAIFVASILP